MREKRLIEAALFMSGRALKMEEIRKLTGISASGYLSKMIQELQKEYDGKAIEIVVIENEVYMRVKEEYLEEVKSFAQDSELSKSALRTLAIISKNDGILKSELVKRLGSQIYQDVKELVERGFIKEKKAGRTKSLHLTKKFRTMFKRTD